MVSTCQGEGPFNGFWGELLMEVSPRKGQQRELYLGIARQSGLRIRRTGRDFDAVSEKVVQEVFSTYMERFHTLVGVSFLFNPGQLNPGGAGP